MQTPATYLIPSFYICLQNYSFKKKKTNKIVGKHFLLSNKKSEECKRYQGGHHPFVT